MACINPDGTLTPSAKSVLTALQAPLSEAEIAQATGLPLYRVRMSLRELIEAGLIIDQTGSFQLTPAGEEKLSS